MTIRRVVPDISSKQMEESRKFYTGFLGFNVGMDMGWIVTFVSPDNPTAQITVMAPQSRSVSDSIELRLVVFFAGPHVAPRPCRVAHKWKWGLLLPGAPEPRLTLLRRQGFKIGRSNRVTRPSQPEHSCRWQL